MMSRSRLRLLAGFALLVVTAPAMAQALQPATPMPPRRPQTLAPATPARPAPEQAPVAAPASEPTPVPERILTREQMRLCSQEWQKKKKAGTAAGWIWRDFAQVCAAELGGG